jgi:hypothetical protein
MSSQQNGKQESSSAYETPPPRTRCPTRTEAAIQNNPFIGHLPRQERVTPTTAPESPMTILNRRAIGSPGSSFQPISIEKKRIRPTQVIPGTPDPEEAYPEVDVQGLFQWNHGREAHKRKAKKQRIQERRDARDEYDDELALAKAKQASLMLQLRNIRKDNRDLKKRNDELNNEIAREAYSNGSMMDRPDWTEEDTLNWQKWRAARGLSIQIPQDFFPELAVPVNAPPPAPVNAPPPAPVLHVQVHVDVEIIEVKDDEEEDEFSAEKFPKIPPALPLELPEGEKPGNHDDDDEEVKYWCKIFGL